MAIVTALLLAITLTGTTAAAKRVAFVVGNADYAHVGSLRNPANDATAIAGKLEALGFEVFKGIDLTFDEFGTLVRQFSKAAADAEAAVFFYAGHGLQVGGKNYLAPVDAEIKAEDDLPFETIDLNDILSLMQRRVKTNLVFLDACRDNPMARALSSSALGRSVDVGSGLARVETGVGTMISFATQPGNVTLDGDGNNSPFTTALLKHIETPDMDVALMMRRVREDVMGATGNRQVPWTNSSLIGEFKLNLAPKPEPEVPAPPAPDYSAALRTGPQTLSVAEECEIGIDPDASLNELLLREVANFSQAAANCRRAVRASDNDQKYVELASIAEEQMAAREAALSGNAAFARAYGAVYSDGRYKKQLNAFLGVPAPQLETVSGQPAPPDETAVPRPAASAPKPVIATPSSEPSPSNPLPSNDGGSDTVMAGNEVVLEMGRGAVTGGGDPGRSGAGAGGTDDMIVESASPSVNPVAAIRKPPAARMDERELARRLQSELNRLGCNAGTPDGLWGPNSQRALQRLVEQLSQLRVASRQLDAGLLDDLKALNGRICPLVCGVTQVKQDGRCVARTCPAGQRLSSRGQCYTPRQEAAQQPEAPAGVDQRRTWAAERESRSGRCSIGRGGGWGGASSRRCR